MKHVDSGDRCRAHHEGPEGESLPDCMLCPTCNAWIRPEHIEDECPSTFEKVTDPFGGLSVFERGVQDEW